MAYPYLMAQLPYLLYDQKPPMTSVHFKEMAQSLMTKNDASVFEKLSLSADHSNAKSGCDFIDKWREWEHALKLNLAKQRAAKLKRENEITEQPPVFPLEAAHAASKAAEDSSPLEGEIHLDKARWKAVDTIAGGDYFHRNAAYAYYLKLLLLERKQSFNTEKGVEEYKALYASIVESARSSRGEHT